MRPQFDTLFFVEDHGFQEGMFGEKSGMHCMLHLCFSDGEQQRLCRISRFSGEVRPFGIYSGLARIRRAYERKD